MPGPSAHRITALDSEKLKSIHQDYLREAEELKKVYSHAKDLVQQVRGKSWVSKGSGWGDGSSARADARDARLGWHGSASEIFFKDMEVEVLPTLDRLPKALELQAKGMEKIVDIFRSAEEEIHSHVKKFRPHG